MDKEATLWRIDKDLELYSSYLDITLKATTFVLAITGAITSYYLAHHKETLIVLSLVLPLIMNVGFLVLALYSIGVAQRIEASHIKNCLAAEIEPYNLRPLPSMLRISAAIFFLSSLGLVFILLGGLR